MKSIKTYMNRDREIKDKNERLDDLSNYIDTHEVYAEDLIAIVLAHLSNYKQTTFKTKMLVNKIKYTITITKEIKDDEF